MIRKLSQSIREYKKDSIISGILILIEVVMEVLIPLTMAYLIDSGISKGNNIVVIKSSLFLLIIAFISLLCGAFASIYSSRASSGFAKNLRHDLFYKIQDFSFFNIDKFQTSSLVTRLTTDVSYIQMSYMMIIRTALRAPLMLILSLASAFFINYKIALIFLIVIPILATVLIVMANIAHPYFKKVFETYDELNNAVSENVRGIRVVKSYVKEDYEKKKFNKISKLIYDRFCKAEKVVSWNQPIMMLCMYITYILIAWFGAKYIYAGTLTTGELTSLFSYSGAILSSLMMVSMIYVMTIISGASAERIVEVLNEESDIKNPLNPIMDIKNGDIEFKNVSFSYVKEKDSLSLENINLKIKSGEVIGVIGGTGTGKTTLISLINRLYDVVSGEVLLAGENVKNYDLKTLRDNVVIVLQKNELFKGSIIDNMRWGKLDASLKEIKEACKIAEASEFIEKLPGKYDYIIEQNGSNVSGGQKQRLCIARALLKKPKVLIFDDSTSAVDTKTDAKIRKALKESLKDVTKIIIAQRINSIEDADKVIVLDDGKLVDFDTPKNLLKRNKIYQEVYYSQKKEGK